MMDSPHRKRESADPQSQVEKIPRHLPAPETGSLGGRWPFARVGSGPRTLVVFPGIQDALADVTVNPRFSAWFCRNLAASRTVCMISRPDGLSEGTGVREIADDYAVAVAEHFDRPDILGVSMGGAIAQEFAARRPELTGRLVLATVGCQMGADQLSVCEQWLELARRQAWRALYLDMIHRAFGNRRRSVFQAFLPRADTAYVRRPTAAADFVISVQACMEFNTTLQAKNIQAPTLVIGGDADVLTPSSQLRDLASRIKGAKLLLLPGAGHGLFEDRKDEFDCAIAEFLAAPTGIC